jgi:hypothetical protein
MRSGSFSVLTPSNNPDLSVCDGDFGAITNLLLVAMIYFHSIRFGPYFCEPIIAGLDIEKDEKTGEIKEDGAAPLRCSAPIALHLRT